MYEFWIFIEILMLIDELSMCEKKILYQPSTHPLRKLTMRGRGEKLNFRQICYATECLTAYANNREIPISNALVELRERGALPGIYRAAIRRVPESSEKVVERLVGVSKDV